MAMVFDERPFVGRGRLYAGRSVAPGAFQVLEAAPVSKSRFVKSAGFTAAAFICLVGTGGSMTPDFVVAREGRGYPLSEFIFEGAKPGVKRVTVRSSADNLAQVRARLKPSVTELASLLQVSRQTIYNWQAGQPIAEQNEACLEQLAAASDILEASGLSQSPSVLRRKLPGGKTLLESIRDGVPGTAAAENLVAMLRKEAGQRQVMEARLGGRLQIPIDTAFVGSPYQRDEA